MPLKPAPEPGTLEKLGGQVRDLAGRLGLGRKKDVSPRTQH
jgi:hypothetical protein